MPKNNIPKTGRNPLGAGRTARLTDELLLKIRELTLQGLKDRDICKKLEIPNSTWDYWMWKNYQGFADRKLEYKNSYLLSLANQNIEDLLKLETNVDVISPFGPVIDKKTGKVIKKPSASFIKIKQDTTHFVQETLNKKYYSKRTELTGADGINLGVIVLPDKKQKDGKKDTLATTT